jgi:hypothetical protein
MTIARRRTKMQKIASAIMLLALTGCNPWAKPNAASILPPSPSTNSCATKPSGALEKKDVKQIALSSQSSITESHQLTAGQQLGYSFDAKKGEKFNFHTNENICVLVYAPSSKLLSGAELSEDGKYTVQVFVPQGSTSFALEMGLGSLSSSQPAPPSPTSSTAPSSSPSSTKQSSNSGAEKALDDMADKIFNEKHPELGGKKIQGDDTGLGREWQQIRACDAIVDYTFHQRHPELGGRGIRGDESALRNEWWSIHGGVDGC